jgi:hypothetical protein
MRSDNPIRAALVIIGLGASLTLSLAACSSTPEGSSEPVGEQMYGNGVPDPVHQEKMREQRNQR